MTNTANPEKYLRPEGVLDFWFDPLHVDLWYNQNDDFDQKIIANFTTLHTHAKQGKFDFWLDSLDGRLAMIILFDQFSRNMYRKDPETYGSDQKALKIAKLALTYGDDIWLKNHQDDHKRLNAHSFIYMPLMHSENLEDQRRCLELFQTHGPSDEISFALEHCDTVARFGRFPHRNAILGRKTTEAEAIYLKQTNIGWQN